jgi:galactokinase
MFAAPGRVNLIGEHTDYNDGLVMPVALDRFTRVLLTRRTDRRLVVHSQTVGKTAEASLDALAPRQDWSDYVFGIAALLQQAGIAVRGAELVISSNVPVGAGLSSSAALEVATAKALLATTDASLDSVALAQLCRRAENEFVGARVGIMDPYVALHGRPRHALLLDCRSLTHQLVPIPAGITLVVANTMVKHALAGSEYNKRRADCEAATRALASRLPHVRALRDVSSAQLEQHATVLTGVEHKRARHVVSENERVAATAAALTRGDIAALALLFSASHRSLRDDYEVSCAELDALVDAAADAPGVRAARMTGGGFGGCTVNVVDENCVDAFKAAVAASYQQRVGRAPEFYV